MRPACEQRAELRRERAPAAHAREPENERQRLVAREAQGPAERAAALHDESFRLEADRQAREPRLEFVRESDEGVQIGPHRVGRGPETPRGAAVRDGRVAVALRHPGDELDEPRELSDGGLEHRQP